MQKVSRMVFGVSMLAIGCAVGAGASRFVVPPANAQQPVHRWQYFCFEETKPAQLQEKANAAGQQGWELVSSVGGGMYLGACFKRPAF